MWSKIYTSIKANCHRMMALQESPHQIAGGVAVGIFFGFTPLFGLKTLLSLGVAAVMGVSPMAAVIAVSLHDIVAPFWPVILRMQYDIGFWILSSPHVFPPHLHVTHLHVHMFDSWATFVKVSLPLLVGSLFFSIPSAVLSYFGFRLVIKVVRNKKRGSGKKTGVGGQ